MDNGSGTEFGLWELETDWLEDVLLEDVLPEVDGLEVVWDVAVLEEVVLETVDFEAVALVELVPKEPPLPPTTLPEAVVWVEVFFSSSFFSPWFPFLSVLAGSKSSLPGFSIFCLYCIVNGIDCGV